MGSKYDSFSNDKNSTCSFSDAEIVRELIAAIMEKILNNIVLELSPEEAQKIQDSFLEYQKVEKEMAEKLGGSLSIKDIKLIIPGNKFLNLFLGLFPIKLPGDEISNEDLKYFENASRDIHSILKPGGKCFTLDYKKDKKEVMRVLKGTGLELKKQIDIHMYGPGGEFVIDVIEKVA